MKKIINHLKDNWIKYGFETFVITIGILGAFSLNNWNETRKEKEVELRFYQELRSDLIKNKHELEGILWYHEDIINPAFESLKVNLFEESVYPSIVNQDLAIISNEIERSIFSNANSTYNYMVNEGFNFIENQHIRSKITTLFEFNFKDVTAGLAFKNKSLLENTRPILLQYGLFHDQYTYEILDVPGLQKNFLIKNLINIEHSHLGLVSDQIMNALTGLDSLVIEIDHLIFDNSGIQYPAATVVNDSTVQNIVGDYMWINDSSRFEVTEIQKRLFWKFSKDIRQEIFYLEEYNFSWQGIVGTFKLNSEKEILEMSITVDNEEWIAVKLE